MKKVQKVEELQAGDLIMYRGLLGIFAGTSEVVVSGFKRTVMLDVLFEPKDGGRKDLIPYKVDVDYCSIYD